MHLPGFAHGSVGDLHHFALVGSDDEAIIAECRASDQRFLLQQIFRVLESETLGPGDSPAVHVAPFEVPDFAVSTPDAQEPTIVLQRETRVQHIFFVHF